MVMRTAGLEWARWIEPIDAFVREWGHLKPRWAVFCTYELEPVRIQRDLLPALRRRGRPFRTLILADAGRLQARLQEAAGSDERTNLHPVRLAGGGVFHAKLAFLRAGNRVRVCVGSANLTSGGMGANLELWGSSDTPEITTALTHFLAQLAQSPHLTLDPPSKRAIKQAITGLPVRPSPRVWTSLDSPFSKRLAVAGAGLKTAQEVHIISPAFASKRGLGDALRPFLRGRKSVYVYTDKRMEAPSVHFRYYCPPSPANPADAAEALEDQDLAERAPSVLHAKAYILRCRRKSTIWFGSANLTGRALVFPPRRGGNVELLVQASLVSSALRELLDDLVRLFSQTPPMETTSTALDEPHASRQGQVLSGEIQFSAGVERLILHLLPGVRQVSMEILGRKYAVPVRCGRGVFQPNCVSLPDESSKVPDARRWAGRVFEIVGKTRIPVMINIPLVPEPVFDGRQVEIAADAWLDELLGRWPLPARAYQVTRTEAKEHDWSDSAAEEDGKRLDQVDHEGMLDRLAVKSALLVRRIRQMPARNGYRRAMRDAIVDTLCAAAEEHLRPVIKSWFMHGAGSEARG